MAKVIDGVEVFDCSTCSDTGRILTVDVRSMQYVAECVSVGSRPERGKLHTFVVACVCQAGEIPGQRNACSRQRALPSFDARVMFVASTSCLTNSDIVKLAAFADAAGDDVRSYWKRVAFMPKLKEEEQASS